MVAQFTDSQVGKRVVDANGVQIGIVQDVREGDMLVEIGTDADPDTLSKLNWDGTVNREVHRLRDQHVADIDEDVVRLNV